MANVVVSSYSLASFFDIVNALVVDGFGFLVKKQVGVLSAVLFQTIALFIPNSSHAGNLDRAFLLGRAWLREGSQGSAFRPAEAGSPGPAKGGSQALVEELEKYTSSQFDQKALRKYPDVNHVKIPELKSIPIAKLAKLMKP